MIKTENSEYRINQIDETRTYKQKKIFTSISWIVSYDGGEFLFE
jgi:hypothetical protein